MENKELIKKTALRSLFWPYYSLKKLLLGIVNLNKDEFICAGTFIIAIMSLFSFIICLFLIISCFIDEPDGFHPIDSLVIIPLAWIFLAIFLFLYRLFGKD